MKVLVVEAEDVVLKPPASCSISWGTKLDSRPTAPRPSVSTATEDPTMLSYRVEIRSRSSAGGRENSLMPYVRRIQNRNLLL